MQRPYETAQIILQNSKDLKIERIDSLVEISHGLWEGKLEAEIKDCLLYTSPSPRDH